MATILIPRGVAVTLASGVSSAGLQGDTLVLPMDVLGARLALTYIWSAAVTAGVADVQASVDGINFQTGTGAAAFDTDSFGASKTSVHVVLCQGVQAIRTNISTAVVGGNVTVKARLQ